ncbi:hypothetical protein, partial [Acinetobacter baumannii]|uniref:hypothetical protein n=1 Tax=Acinetobacter baumannii TaxID=470 RepID=UPI001C4539BB
LATPAYLTSLFVGGVKCLQETDIDNSETEFKHKSSKPSSLATFASSFYALIIFIFLRSIYC